MKRTCTGLLAVLALSVLAVFIGSAAAATSTPEHECQESHNSNDHCPATTTTLPPPTTVTSVPVVPTTVPVPPATPITSLPVTGGNEDTLTLLLVGAVLAMAVGSIVLLRQCADSSLLA